MYLYQSLFTDETVASQKKKILRKLWMNIGQLDIYLICLNGGQDQFDIIHTGVLKQKRYPKKDLYLLGIAKGWQSAAELSGQIYMHFFDRYQKTEFKEDLEAEKATLFRRF